MSISALLRHHDPKVQEFALLLSDIETALKSGQLTEQEYVQLMVDVERMKKVIELANDLSLNITMNEVIYGLMDVAKSAKFLL